MTHPKPPLPKLPATFTAPKTTVTVKPDGTMELPGYFPFLYSGIQNLWVWYLVDLKHLDAMLAPVGMKAARFANGGDMGLVNINFFNAAVLYGAGQPGNPGAGGFNETEVNLVAYPVAQEASVPTSYTLEGYIGGGDQQKKIGNYRAWVACDNAVAVAAGIQRYFEIKFLADYDYSVPNGNNDPQQQTWEWTCYEPSEIAGKSGPPPLEPFIYRGSANLQGLASTPANMGEYIDLSFDTHTKRPVASRRVYFGLIDTFLLDNVPGDPVQLTVGTSQHPMRADLQKLIAGRSAFAVQRFVSAPVIAEGSPYYADV